MAVVEKPPAVLLLKQNWEAFVLYVVSFVHMGAFVGVLGPTLLHLAAQTNTSVREQAFILGMRSVGFFTGSLLAGHTFDKFDHGKELLLGSLLVAAVLTGLMPVSASVYAYAVISVGQSIACGMIDNLAQVLLIKVFSANLNPFMQSLHCGFGLGCVFAPIVVSPFVSDSDGDTMAHYDDRYKYAYWIISAFAAPTIIWLLVFTLRHRSSKYALLQNESEERTEEIEKPTKVTETVLDSITAPQQDGEHQTEEKAEEHPHTVDEPVDVDAKMVSPHAPWKLVALMGFFLFLYVGCETGYGSYLAAYSFYQLDFSPRRGASITLLYWMFFTLGRFLGVFISVRVAPSLMVRTDLIGCTVTLITLVVFREVEWVLWAGSAVYGIAVATVYPSSIAWMSERVDVGGKVLSYLVMAACAGDALVPTGEGFALSQSPVGFLLVAMVCVVLATVLFFVLEMVMNKVVPKKEKETPKDSTELMALHTEDAA